jgi:hypothetical protein
MMSQSSIDLASPRRHRSGGRLLALLAVGAMAIASGCTSNSSSSKSLSHFEISTSDGQVSLSLDGKLPPGWPTNVPVPSGAEPAGSGSLVGTSNGLKIAVYKTTDSPQQVYDFYTTESSITLTSQSSVGSGSNFVGRVKMTAPVTATTTIVPHDGETLIAITITGAHTDHPPVGSR